MKHWRAVLLLILLLVPIVVLVAFGIWALWTAGWWWWLWWLLPICWGLAYLLARWWQPAVLASPVATIEVPSHWTTQDEDALKIVEQQQQSINSIAPDRLTDPQFYLQTALDLGRTIARHYHPKATDPISSLTVPEILAVAHLACEDLEKWVHDYFPGSHLLTLEQWRTLAKAPAWLRVTGNVSWAVMMLVQPANIARYLASKLTMDSATQRLKANVLAWFYIIFVRRVGFYVIEMNSGRLRGGAERYRAMTENLRGEEDSLWIRSPVGTSPSADQSQPIEVTIALVGQVNAGKSSLINALLRESNAATDVLPLTQQVQRYQLQLPEAPDRLILLDTPGYGKQGATRTELHETQVACQNADLILLVMKANDPAREADLHLMREMSQWYAAHVKHKPPPIVGVLTHIDLLSPVMQWDPPYDWLNPARPKEQSIRGAVEYNAEQLGEQITQIVPVCSDVERQRAYGTQESLLPAMITLLGEARACALIRALHQELDSGQVRKTFFQLYSAGTGLARFFLLGEKAAAAHPAIRLNDTLT